MADPLSLLASLLAVASAGIAVSKKIYKLADAIDSSGDEISSIGEQVSDTARVIRDLNDFLEDARDLISAKALLDASQLLQRFKDIFTKIGKMLHSAKREDANNIWNGIRWTFTREKVKPMCAKLESYKLTLIIMLSTMKLAKCKSEIDNE